MLKKIMHKIIVKIYSRATEFNFGVRQNGNKVGDVELPKWCGGDARLFILAHRAALESDIVREVLPYWIDLVFGFRQTGRPAIEAINVFHPAVNVLTLSQRYHSVASNE